MDAAEIARIKITTAAPASDISLISLSSYYHILSYTINIVAWKLIVKYFCFKIFQYGEEQISHFCINFIKELIKSR